MAPREEEEYGKWSQEHAPQDRRAHVFELTHALQEQYQQEQEQALHSFANTVASLNHDLATDISRCFYQPLDRSIQAEHHDRADAPPSWVTDQNLQKDLILCHAVTAEDFPNQQKDLARTIAQGLTRYTRELLDSKEDPDLEPTAILDHHTQQQLQHSSLLSTMPSQYSQAIQSIEADMATALHTGDIRALQNAVDAASHLDQEAQQYRDQTISKYQEQALSHPGSPTDWAGIQQARMEASADLIRKLNDTQYNNRTSLLTDLVRAEHNTGGPARSPWTRQDDDEYRQAIFQAFHQATAEHDPQTKQHLAQELTQALTNDTIRANFRISGQQVPKEHRNYLNLITLGFQKSNPDAYSHGMNHLAEISDIRYNILWTTYTNLGVDPNFDHLSMYQNPYDPRDEETQEDHSQPNQQDARSLLDRTRRAVMRPFSRDQRQ